MGFLCYNHLIIVRDDLLKDNQIDYYLKWINKLSFYSLYLELTGSNKIYLHIKTPKVGKI